MTTFSLQQGLACPQEDFMENTLPGIHREKYDHRLLLQEQICIVAFLKDVTCSQALTSEGEHLGITQDGEQGLSVILAGVEESLNKVMARI